MSIELRQAPMDRSAVPILQAGRRVHMVGIGGSGMSAAASLLRAIGVDVSGSDSQPFPGLGELVQQGARVAIGHAASLVDPNVELVVRSAAVPDSNPEILEARASGMRILKYAELLGAMMATRRGVAVAGTHGKSTTTAMTAHTFRRAGLDPSFVVGARSPQLGGSSGHGRGEHFIVEACEFDRSFLQFRPESAAILNVEPDHLDCFADLDAIVEAFGRFAAQVDSKGLLVCNHEDVSALRAAQMTRADVETFGFDAEADWRAYDLRQEQGRYAFSVSFRDTFILSTRLSIPGMHNVSNALAAIALARHGGAEPGMIAKAVADFAGVDRRMSLRGQAHGVTILDDYAHHPTEIKVTIEAARGRYSPKRTWVIFQPHQYSRTRSLMGEFAASFALADEVIVPDIYGARESDDRSCREGAEELVSRIRQQGRPARYASSLGAAAGHLIEHVMDGDLVLTMGAGDVWKVADELVARAFADRMELDAPLARRTWFGLGGSAKYLCQPLDTQDVADLAARSRDAGVPFKVLGAGANILVSDDGFDGVVIRLDDASFRGVHRQGNRLRVGAGVDLMPLSRTCSENGLAGLEGLAGIPASIGGAVRMNAGGRFGEMSQVVREIEVLTPDGLIERWPKERVGFAYRHSAIDEEIVLSAELELTEGDPAEIGRRYHECFAHKMESQPIREHSAGCIFKNPKGRSAGALIDQAGLKGTRCGGARVSERHANFIVAEGGATASDVLRLIDVVRDRVHRELATELELEIDVWRPRGRGGAAA